MSKITILELKHEIKSDTVEICLSHVFQELETGTEVSVVIEKYQKILIDLSNELLVVIKEGVAKRYKAIEGEINE